MGFGCVIELDEDSIYFFENKKNYQSTRKKVINTPYVYDFQLHISENECRQIYYSICAIRNREVNSYQINMLYSSDNALDVPFELSAIIIPGIYLGHALIKKIKMEAFQDHHGKSAYKGIIFGNFINKKIRRSVWQEV